MLKKNINKLPWSPTEQSIARNFSYWKQKLVMAKKKIFHSQHLDQLQQHINISDEDHSNHDFSFIHQKMEEYHNQWKAVKKRSTQMRQTSLQDRALMMAEKMKTNKEKALKAILAAEASRRSYASINAILGKHRAPLTQIDIVSPDSASGHSHSTLTNRKDI
jgi:hypothetical protein